MPRPPRRAIAPLLAAAAVLLAGIMLAMGRLLPRTRGVDAPTDDAVAVRTIEDAGIPFTVVEVNLQRASLRLFWKTPDGNRYGNFVALKEHLARSGQRLLFAANAGIFDPTFTPCGLHVEDGRQWVPLNLKEGGGNFYLKPNGVLMADERGAGIIDATRYPGTRPGMRLAMQSGPLLVLDGTINPQFRPDSANRHIRSAVGVSSPHRLVFALSRRPVTFHAVACLFRDRLSCPNALYLDGVISRFYLPPQLPQSHDGDFAALLAVTVPQ